jgi:hypothetical protein
MSKYEKKVDRKAVPNPVVLSSDEVQQVAGGIANCHDPDPDLGNPTLGKHKPIFTIPVIH